MKDAAENMAQGFGSLIQEAVGNKAGILAKAAARVAPGEIERMGLNLLQKEKNKQKLLALCENTLHDKGVWLELVDFELEQSKNGKEIIDCPQEAVEKARLFSEELEEKVLDVIVDYIKPLLN